MQHLWPLIFHPGLFGVRIQRTEIFRRNGRNHAHFSKSKCMDVLAHITRTYKKPCCTCCWQAYTVAHMTIKKFDDDDPRLIIQCLVLFIAFCPELSTSDYIKIKGRYFSAFSVKQLLYSLCHHNVDLSSRNVNNV
jgi:hypothetical protein